MKKVLKAIALFLSWLTLSPLLLILDGRWKLLPRWLRIVLFVFSPLMVVLTFVLIIATTLGIAFADTATVNHFHHHYYTKPSVLQKITGVSFPDYKITDYSESAVFSLRLRHYDTTLEFEEIPDESFYKALEKHSVNYIGENDSVRTFTFKKPYKYLSINYAIDYGSLTRGDAFVEIKEGSKTITVTMFEWPDNNAIFKEE
jgi:hypothetical protein